MTTRDFHFCLFLDAFSVWWLRFWHLYLVWNGLEVPNSAEVLPLGSRGHGVGIQLEPKVLQARVRAIRQADRMTGSSVTFARQQEVKTSTKTSSKKTVPRPSVFDRLGSPTSSTQRTVTQEPPFPAGAGRARPRPFQGSKKSGKSSYASAAKKRWRVPGGGSPSRLCPALAESAGQLPGHRHHRGRGGHCIPATTSAHSSKHQFPDQEQLTRPSTSRRCLVDEGSHRTSHQREVPGFLQSVVSGAQEDRRSATCDRPVHSQPPHGGSTLQDGDARVHPISHQKSGVGGVDRHTRCLSSCADASSCPQVSAFRGQQEGVQVHLSSVWTGNFSTGVHQAAETRRLSVEAARCEATRLLRRLADQSRYTGGSSTAFPDNHQGPPVSRMDHQLREVRPHTKSRLPVHWDAVQHSTLHSGAPAENANKGPVSSSTLDGQSEHNCQRSAQTSRHVGVHGLAGLTRTAPSSSSPMVGRYSIVPEDRELVRPDSSSTVGSVKGGMVVIRSSPARSTPRRQGDGSDSLHRCVQFGLGSPVRLTLDTGTVVSISTIVPHKRSRDAGCHLCCERLPTSSEVPSGETDVRQCSDGGVHQERGGHEIAHFDADDHSAAQVVRQQGDYVGSRPSARSTQYPGGFPVQSRPDSDHGVDDGHGESTTSVCQVGRTTDRYVCDIRQQTTRQVHFAISGPQGGVDRCHVHALGQGEGPLVHLPAIQDGPASSAEDRSITRTAGDTDRSTATGSIMVSRADGPNPRRPGSPVCGRSRPALRAILRAKGHSREAANMMSRCLRESSQQVYESHWSRFVAFCRTKRWQVFQVRSHHFSTYMMHLFRDDLLPSTIISHRTSVASVLRHWVYDPAADLHIKLLVRAFRLERPVQRRIMPKWDLHLVLLSLMRPPFTSQSEDDGESSEDVIPLKWWTLKCLFLLALASARRRSYLHALSIAPGRCVFARGNTQRQLVVSLLPEPGFLAKNQLPTQAPEWITVPGIAHLNPTEPERMLCPVRQPGLGKNPGGPAANVHSLEPQHQRYHEEPHKPMDRGDCQGSLHSSWSSVWPCDSSWGPSTVSFMGV